MTVNRPIPMDQTYERVLNLGSMVRKCWERARNIDRVFEESTREIEETHRSTCSSMEEEHERAVQSAEQEFRTLEKRFHQQNTRRKALIERGLRTSLRQYRERIKVREGNRKYKIQMERMRLERELPVKLAEIDGRYEKFCGSKDACDDRIDDLLLEARRVFRGYDRLLRKAWEARESPGIDEFMDEYGILKAVQAWLDKVESDIHSFGKRPLSRAFRILSPQRMFWLTLLGGGAALLFSIYAQEGWGDKLWIAGVMSIVFGLILAAWVWGKHKARPVSWIVGGRLGAAEKYLEMGLERAAMRRHEERNEAEHNFARDNAALDEEWRQAEQDAAAEREDAPRRIQAKSERVAEKNEELLQNRISSAKETHDQLLSELQKTYEHARLEVERGRAESERLQRDQHSEKWDRLRKDWEEQVVAVHSDLARESAELDARFPSWSSPVWDQWVAADDFPEEVRIGQIQADIEQLTSGVPPHEQLPFPGTLQFGISSGLSIPDGASLSILSPGPAHGMIQNTLNNIMLRLLTSFPPGKVDFTILDPLELGQNFAGIMHLTDYEDSLVNKRIWTESRQIEQKLAEMNEHMEKVIQMYLRNDYRDLAEYNRQAGEIAEKYHFLVVADFPSGFSELALRRLAKIAASGPRCGIFMLIHWDARKKLPPGMSGDDLQRNSQVLESAHGTLFFNDHPTDGLQVRLEEPPDADRMNQLLRRVGECHRGASRVEVPFGQIAPREDQIWTRETREEVRVPIGRTGATKLQELALGLGTRQHALVVGKTGSGKSNLFHVLITNLSLWSSPKEVEFYLIDFKKGVEFKCYANHRLPHARVVAIESEREFGLSVLQRIDQELNRRGELFRSLGVQDLQAYQRAGGKESIPRTLLLVDEFQEFFVDDDRIAQSAALLLDRLVRQGRAFGVHVILGSQTLGGAYTLARTTLGQMVVRIALQCNEADSFLIMDENNTAPRLLSRPGEAIYNDSAGMQEGNSPFQVVWLPEVEREGRLEQLRMLADARGFSDMEPVVFEGNAPAGIEENRELERCMREGPVSAGPDKIWLGSPNSIKGPTKVVFRRQSGSHLLIAGQREENVYTIAATSIVGLAAQKGPKEIHFYVLDSSPADSSQRAAIEMAAEAVPHSINWAGVSEIDQVMEDLSKEMDRRIDSAPEEAGEWPSIFVFIPGLQKLKKLRYEEDFGFSLDEAEQKTDPGKMLNRLIGDGSHVGIHLVVACDTFNNINRFLGRKAITEFGARVLFQMSPNDSVSLIDSPAAANLGLHRALFYSEHEGQAEVFRPYARPEKSWYEHVSQCLETSSA